MLFHAYAVALPLPVALGLLHILSFFRFLNSCPVVLPFSPFSVQSHLPVSSFCNSLFPQALCPLIVALLPAVFLHSRLAHFSSVDLRGPQVEDPEHPVEGHWLTDPQYRVPHVKNPAMAILWGTAEMLTVESASC